MHRDKDHNYIDKVPAEPRQLITKKGFHAPLHEVQFARGTATRWIDSGYKQNTNIPVTRVNILSFSTSGTRLKCNSFAVNWPHTKNECPLCVINGNRECTWHDQNCARCWFHCFRLSYVQNTYLKQLSISYVVLFPFSKKCNYFHCNKLFNAKPIICGGTIFPTESAASWMQTWHQILCRHWDKRGKRQVWAEQQPLH